MYKKFRESSLFSIVACIILVISIASLIIPDKSVSDAYDNKLDYAPKINLNSLWDGSFAQSYEKYVNDQIWLRDSFLKAKSFTEWILLKTESNGVSYGQGQYMFSKFYNFQTDTLVNNLDAIDIFSYNSVNDVSVMVVPSASYPLVDSLPGGLPVVDQGYYISEIYRYLSNTTNTINIKDRLAISTSEYIYYRTDPHWTTYGASLAYEQFALSRDFHAYKYESGKATKVAGYLGSNYSKCKAFNVRSDTIEYFDFPAEVSFRDFVTDEYGNTQIQNVTRDGLYDYSKFDSSDKYQAFLHGSHDYAVIKSERNSSKMDTIVVICDSFAYSFIPFLTQNYNEIIMIDMRFYTGSFEEIRDTRYDDVLVLLGFETICENSGIVQLAF